MLCFRTDSSIEIVRGFRKKAAELASGGLVDVSFDSALEAVLQTELNVARAL